MKKDFDVLFDSPCYDEVLKYGREVWRKETEARLAQVYEYRGVEYALLWDRETGQNLRYTTMDEIRKERERKDG